MTITLTREEAQQVLEGLENIAKSDWRKWEELADSKEFERWVKSRANHMAQTLRARLAQPEAEREQGDMPCIEDDGCPTEKAVLQRFWRKHRQPEPEPVTQYSDIISDGGLDPRNKFDTAPPQYEWQGLTDEEINKISDEWRETPNGLIALSRAIEAKLKEKNT